MNEFPLERALEQGPCPKCGTGRVRIIDVVGGTHLLLRCRGLPGCRWQGRSRLPQLKKKLVYLDTATVSNIAKALHRKEHDSAWMRLYDALRRGTALEAILCPTSMIVRSEAELARLSNEIMEIARELGAVSLKSQLRVQEAQLFSRAAHRERRGACHRVVSYDA